MSEEINNYSTPATSATPALIIYLLDVSGSMFEPCGDSTKIEVVTNSLRKMVVKMVQRSTKGAVVSPRYRIAMFAYTNYVTDLLDGILTIDDLAQRGIPKLTPLDMTNTQAAFEEAEKLLNKELNNLQQSPAPLICHMTDGEYNMGDPTDVVKRIMEISVPDGKVLIENIFISNDALASPIDDPKAWSGLTNTEQLSDIYARKLFEMSSPLPESYLDALGEMGYKNFKAGSRMMLPGNNPEMVELGFVMSAATKLTESPQVSTSTDEEADIAQEVEEETNSDD